MAHLLTLSLGHLRAVRRRLRDERGMSMVAAMLITMSVFTIGGVWTAVAAHQIDGSAQDRRREQALAAAEAGINLAMSRLTADPGYTGAANAALADATGEYEMTVSAVNPADPNDTRRYIVAKGYAPTKANAHRAARRLEQQVDLIATDSFRFALFASPGGVASGNNMTVTGDVYSNTDLNLAQYAKVFGNVTSLGAVTTANNSTIGGDIDAVGNITVDNSNTVVQGSARSGGNVTMTGCVKGTVQAAGTISGSPPGSCPHNWAQYSPPTPPKSESLPTFTWDPANYASSTTWASPSAFQTYFNNNTGSFSGVHRVNCASPCSSSIALDTKWTMSGDVTIVTDSPITLSRDVSNGTANPVTLTVVSLATATPAISMTNNITLPTDVHVLFYAPNGSADFSNLKHFSGVVYAKNVNVSQQFTLTFTPVTAPGFAWNLASSSHFQIQSRAYKEVPFS